MEIIYLNAVGYHVSLPLDVKHCFKMLSLQFHFQFGKQSKIMGTKFGKSGGWGMITMLLVTNSVAVCVGGHIVMMKEPSVVAPRFQSFL
jgi:hypothetical protein